MTRAQRAGVGAAACAFMWWGLLPLYLHLLGPVPPLQITCWRYVMTCVVTMTVLAFRRELAATLALLRVPALLWRLVVCALTLGVNWGLYVWAVSNDRVVDASLGYFINPLFNVVLGVLLLGEKLNRQQWLAVCLAALGVALMGLSTHQWPWIALLLAASFSTYGLIRKTAAVTAVPGLALETLLGLPLALAWLAASELQHGNAFHHGGGLWLLLALTGPISAVPLVLFAYGAQRINYSTVGMLQYFTPTLQFLCAVLVFHEPVSAPKFACFTLIWAALLLYASSHWRRGRLSFNQPEAAA
jgi:chloramphenicol-sensitive protein RarD